MKIENESLTQQIAALAAGSATATTLARKSLECARHFSALNAFAALDETVVMRQAEAATQRRLNGQSLSPIDGIPIAIKDNYLTQDYPTTACSDATPLEPSGVDATIVSRLRAAGAVIFGKTNMHEWAFGATNSTSNIGATRNPHNPDHITGGSSGGSGVAVASGVVTAALGSDTGGSVRIPAAACGIYGFKPSYGRASRFGVLPLSWSLDAPGLLTSSLEDITLLLPFLLGPDPKDTSTSMAQGPRMIRPLSHPKVINLVGPGLERTDEVDAALNAAVSTIEMPILTNQLPDIATYFAAWEAILHCEASAYHSTLLHLKADRFSPVTRAHLEAGNQLTGVEFLEAQKQRGKLLKTLIGGLPCWDVLMLPTLPVPAPLHGEDWQQFGGRNVTTQDSMTWFCWLGNLAGLPCLTIPIGDSSSGLPIGMMLMGKPGRDEELLAVAQMMDREINGRDDANGK